MSNFLTKETLILSLDEEEADLENFYPEKFNDIDGLATKNWTLS